MTIHAWVPDNQGDGRGCSLSFSNGNGHGGFSDRLELVDDFGGGPRGNGNGDGIGASCEASEGDGVDDG